MSLTPKQRAFVRHYVALGHNAKEAALKAGVSTGSAKTIGHRWLHNPAIRAEIDRLDTEALAEAVSVNPVVNRMLTGVDRLATQENPAVAVHLDGDMIAKLSKTFVLAALVETMELCMGKRMYAITTVTVDENGNKKTVTVYKTILNPAGVVSSANLLLKETGLSVESQKDEDPENLAELWARLEAHEEKKRA